MATIGLGEVYQKTVIHTATASASICSRGEGGLVILFRPSPSVVGEFVGDDGAGWWATLAIANRLRGSKIDELVKICYAVETHTMRKWGIVEMALFWFLSTNNTPYSLYVLHKNVPYIEYNNWKERRDAAHFPPIPAYGPLCRHFL
jgi:hypothetical protein